MANTMQKFLTPKTGSLPKLFILLRLSFLLGTFPSVHVQNVTSDTPPTTPSLNTAGNGPNVTSTVESLVTKKNLTILGLFPMGGQWPGGKAMLPAAQLALEHINSRQDILADYTLGLMWGDTACDAGVGVNSMYELLNSPPIKVMVLGAGCSPVTETTARASHLWNLVQIFLVSPLLIASEEKDNTNGVPNPRMVPAHAKISYVSASPALSNKVNFPKFFRVGASELALNPTKIEMMKYFGWSKVATIHESIELFSLVTEDLVRALPQHNITLITSEIFSDDPSVQVANLKKHDARIIFAGVNYGSLYKLMCAAYKEGLYGPRYLWVLPGWFQAGWWTEATYDGSTECTAAQIQQVAEGYMGLGTVYINPHQVVGISGHSPSTWEAEMSATSGYPDLDGSYVAAQGYDAAWAVALALNHTQNEINERGLQFGLEDFNYTYKELGDLIFSNMWKVDFQGIKGRMLYDSKGDCLDNVRIMRFQENTLPVVAYHQPLTGNGIDWIPESPIIWKDGRPPKDSTRKLVEQTFVPDAAYGTMVTLAAVGVVTAILLLIFNVTFRNEKLIKMSSPVLNNIILVGCVISYSTVIFQERAVETTIVLCKVRSFTIMVGFSMSFGALFAKTWRVYVIFTNKTKKKVLHDIQLVGIVAVLVLLDIVIFISQLLADPHSVVETVVSTREEDFGDLVIEETVSECSSSLAIYFMAVNYSVKGLLLIFGVFLAWQTRKVTIPALNDSKLIGVCIYNVVLLSLVAVLLASVLGHQVTLKYVLVNAMLIIGVSITQLTIFIPKIYKFWQLRNKVGEVSENEETGTAFKVPTAHASQASSSVKGECQNLNCQKIIAALREENNKLKNLPKEAASQTE